MSCNLYDIIDGNVRVAFRLVGDKKLRNEPYKRTFRTHTGKPLKRADVDKATLAIWQEYEKRRTTTYWENKFRSKNENHINFYRREIYILGLELLRNPPTSWSMNDLVENVRTKKTTRPDAMGSVFHDLFMCIYQDDLRISRQERSKMAMELEYAYRHDISPELLCGFIYQSGNRKDLSRKLK